MFEQRYRQLNDRRHPEESLIQATLAASRQPTRTVGLPKRIAVALCFLLLLLTTGTAIASTFDLTPILERFFPDTAKDFSAVGLSDTEQGITMTVLQANLTVDGNVELLIEFSGDAIDDSAYPHFHSTPVFPSSQGPVEEYDKPNAILWRQRGYADHADWFTEDGLFTVTMYRISLGRHFHPTLHHDLDLTALPIADTFANTSTTWNAHSAEDETQTCLVPGQPIIEMEKGMAITAVGFTEDGLFVIQTRAPMDLLVGEGVGACLVPKGCAEDDWQSWILGTDLHGWFDESGVYYYCDNVYPVTAGELGSYLLRTYYYTVEEVLEGDWTVTIDVNSLTHPAE